MSLQIPKSQKKFRLFLAVEGKNNGYPNYEDAKVHFLDSDPSSKEFENQFACSPLFSVNPEGVNSLPLITDGTVITFIMVPNVFPTFSELLSEISFSNELWFTIGIANLIVIEKDNESSLSKQIIEYLKQKQNITAYEIWTINEQKISNQIRPVTLIENFVPHKYSQIRLSEKLPLHISFAVSEFIISINKFLSASKKFTPFYYEKHVKTINASTDLVNDLSFLYGDTTFTPSSFIIDSFAGWQLTSLQDILNKEELNEKREELINDRHGRLVQFNSVMSYVYSQAYSGTFPIFDHIGIIRRHSLLGIGSAVSALFELISHIEEGLFNLPFENLDSTAYKTSNITNIDFFSSFFAPSNHKVENWKTDSIRNNIITNSNPSRNRVPLPEDFFCRLAFYSGRLGFREYDLAATAAIQVLVESHSLQWNIINYTHEIIHNHVRIILNQILVPPKSVRQETYSAWINRNIQLIEKVFNQCSNWNLPESISYIDYFQLTLLMFCINSRYHGSLTLESNEKEIIKLHAEAKSYYLPNAEALNLIILELYKDITEIFVHVIDFSYIYARNIDTYVQSIWASWSTVTSVSIDLKQYILRTLLVISTTLDGENENRFLRSKQQFLNLLSTIANQNNNSYLFKKIQGILNDSNDDLWYRFNNCLIISDLASVFFVGTLQQFLDNQDENRLGNDYVDENGHKLIYNLEPNSFQAKNIKSKVSFLLDQLIRKTYNLEKEIDHDENERNSAWLLLSLSSINYD